MFNIGDHIRYPSLQGGFVMNYYIIRTPEKQLPIFRVIKAEDGSLLLEIKDGKQIEVVSILWLLGEIFKVFRYAPKSHDL